MTDHAEALAKALADLTDAFLSRNRGCFPIDKVTDEQKHWNRAMKRAYELVGQPNTPARGLKLAAYRSRPAAEVVAWPNGCDTEVPAALRFLADYARPSGGEQRFNAAHLHQLASEIEAMVRRPLYTAPAVAGTEPAGEVVWAVEKWKDEVENRPLRNVHRRSLDDTWRQVIRHFGGDDEALCGPRHDDLVAANPAAALRDQSEA